MIRLLFVGHLCLRNILEAKLERDPKDKHRFILTFDGVSVFQWFSLKLCGIHMKTVIGARGFPLLTKNPRRLPRKMINYPNG